MKKAVRIGAWVLGAFLLANFLYAGKSLLGINIDPDKSHGDLFPLGSLIYHQFHPVYAPLSFEDPYLDVDSPPGQGWAAGEIAAGWGDNSTWGPAFVRYRSVPSDLPGHRLAQEVRVDRVDRGGACQLVQSVSLKPGHPYRASVTVRATKPMRIALLLRQGPKPYRVIASHEATVGTRWQMVTVSGTCQTEDLDRSRALLMVRATEPGAFEVGAAALAEVGARKD